MDDQRKLFQVADYAFRMFGEAHPSKLSNWNRVKRGGRNIGRFRQKSDHEIEVVMNLPRYRESKTRAPIQTP